MPWRASNVTLRSAHLLQDQLSVLSICKSMAKYVSPSKRRAVFASDGYAGAEHSDAAAGHGYVKTGHTRGVRAVSACPGSV
jgi:hypothetical protein